MRERPILFSAPMVLALLAGTKTQTRRVLKSIELARGEARGVRVAPNTFCYLDFDGVPGLSWRPFGGSPTVPLPQEKVDAASPYGAPGDRLWVKETWRPVLRTHNRVERIRYAADGQLQIKAMPGGWRRPKAAKTGNVSPLFMPRWASRITLEVTHVRVERLHSLSCGDAEAEGIDKAEPPDGAIFGWRDYGAKCKHGVRSPITSFRSLWESINGPGSWAANSWVWVISFRRLP